MSILFGPVPSRRLGRSLGINNIPAKICSYSCVYCQVGITKNPSIERKEFYSPMVIYTEVKNRLKELKDEGEKVDYIAFVPDGEPTLDINLFKTIELLHEFKIPIAVFTNSSLLWESDVRKALYLADYVSVKIDSINKDIWIKIDRPSPLLNLNQILDGILEFKNNYTNMLVTETMLIDGINDNESELKNTANFVKKVEPMIAYLTVPTRPTPIKYIKRPDIERTKEAFNIFKSIYPNTILLDTYEGNEFTIESQIENGLISIMAVHPMRKDAVEKYLLKAKSDWDVIKKLIDEQKIKELEYDGNIFYKKII